MIGGGGKASVQVLGTFVALYTSYYKVYLAVSARWPKNENFISLAKLKDGEKMRSTEVRQLKQKQEGQGSRELRRIENQEAEKMKK